MLRINNNKCIPYLTREPCTLFLLLWLLSALPASCGDRVTWLVCGQAKIPCFGARWGFLFWLTVAFKSVCAIAHIKMKLLSHPWHDLYPTTKGLLVMIVCILPPPSCHPLTGPPMLRTPSASRAILEIKPNCSWQFTPREWSMEARSCPASLGFFIRKAFVPFGRKIVLGKLPQPSQQTGIVLCAVTVLVTEDSRTKKTQSLS